MKRAGMQRHVRVVSASGTEVCSHCVVARTPLRRLRGLLARPAPGPGTGLLLQPCSAIHTLFLSFPIEVVFLGADGEVLRVVSRLAPWRAASQRGGRSVLELAPGTCAQLGVTAGDRLVTYA